MLSRESGSSFLFMEDDLRWLRTGIEWLDS